MQCTTKAGAILVASLGCMAGAVSAIAAPPGATPEPRPAMLALAETPLVLATESWTHDTPATAVQVSLFASTPLARRSDFAATGGTRRVRLLLTSRVSSDLVGRLLMRGVEKTSSAREVAAQVDGLLQLGRALSVRSHFAPGQSVGFEFVPGRGTRMLIDNAVVGGFVGDESLFTLLLRPWLGAEAGPASGRSGLGVVGAAVALP